MTTVELEGRLRSAAVAYARSAPQIADLEHRILLRIAVTPRHVHPPRMRLLPQLAMALAIVAGVAVVGVTLNRLRDNRTAEITAGPPALANFSMVVDATNGDLVVFGGYGPDSNPSATTWTWDGSSWTRRHPVHSPPPRMAAAATFDAARGVVVLFGGSAPGGKNLNDTWLWDGRDWRRAQSRLTPPPWNGYSMVDDPAIGQVVLVDLGQTWLWDGTAWSAGPPAPGTKGGMVYDPRSRTVLFLTFAQDQSKVPELGTWAFDGQAWLPKTGAGIAASASLPTLFARDPATGSVIGLADQGHAWTWDGNRWTARAVPGTPPLAGGAGIDYDPLRNIVLLLGGQTPDGGVQSEFWKWDGKAWSLLGGSRPQPTPPLPAASEAPALSLGAAPVGGDWLVRRSAHNVLYQTVDGGRSWQPRLHFDGLYDGMSLSADGQIGVMWTIDTAPTGCTSGGRQTTCAAQPSWALTVYSTVDGGVHWTQRAPTPWPASDVYFRGANGWALSQSPATGFGSGPLYHTTDAGATWTKMGTVPLTGMYGGRTYGVGETWLIFASEQRGWFATAKDATAGDSGLLMTTDGGRTWKPQPVEPPPGMATLGMIVGYPELLPNGQAMLPVVFGHRTDSNTFATSQHYVYISTDGGLTWGNPRPLRAGGLQPPGSQYMSFYLDATHWWFTSLNDHPPDNPVPSPRQSLARSTDGGRSWQVFQTPAIIQMVFSDADHGWAEAVTGPNNTNILLRTTDGGAHWQQVQVP